MKILTEEESQGISLIRQGRNSLLRKMLQQLQTGRDLNTAKTPLAKAGCLNA